MPTFRPRTALAGLLLLLGLSLAPSAEASTPHTVERGRLAVWVEFDFGCDGYVQYGVDRGLPEATVDVTNGEGRRQTQQTSTAGLAYFHEDVSVGPGETVQIEVALPRHYRGRAVVTCPQSRTRFELRERDFAPNDYTAVRVRANLGGEVVSRRPGLAILEPADDAVVAAGPVPVLVEVLDFALGVDGSLAVSVDGVERLTTTRLGFEVPGLAPGEHRIEVRLVDTNGRELSPPVRDAVTVHVEQRGLAVLRAIHVAPFAMNINDTAVEIRLDGQRLVEATRFGDHGTYTIVDAGRHAVTIVSSTGTLATGEIDLVAGGEHSLVLTGDGVNQAIDTLLLTDDNAPPVRDARLRVVHVAPFAPGRAPLAVTAGGVTIAPELAYRAEIPYGTVAAGRYPIVATGPGGAPEIRYELALEPDSVSTLFIVGDGQHQPQGGERVVYVPGAPPDAAMVWWAQLAPLPGAVLARVDLSLDGRRLATGLAFGEHSAGYVAVPPGEARLRVAASAGGYIVLERRIRLEPNGHHTVAIVGDGVRMPLMAVVLTDDPRTAGPGSAALRTVHAAPFTDSLADSIVDVVHADGSPWVRFLSFGEASPYQTLPAGTQAFRVLSGQPAVERLGIAPYQLKEGVRATMFLVGDEAGHPLDSLVIRQVEPGRP